MSYEYIKNTGYNLASKFEFICHVNRKCAYKICLSSAVSRGEMLSRLYAGKVDFTNEPWVSLGSFLS